MCLGWGFAVGLSLRDYFAEKKQIRDETARLRADIEKEWAEQPEENARYWENWEKENARQWEILARQRENFEKENARSMKEIEKFCGDILLKVEL